MRRLGMGILGLMGGLVGAPLLFGATVSAQGQGTAWLHVRVEESRGSKVSVNLPLGVVEAALKAAPETVMTGDKLHLGLKDKSLKISDIRKMWLELKRSGDVDLVTVQDGNETVNVAKKGELLLVQVRRTDKKEDVHIEIPSDVVDALFEGDGDTLNVRGALLKLQGRRGDIVRVNDKDNMVRVWIDEAK